MATTVTAPVLFASHGSPWMCAKESSSSRFWGSFGKEALANNVKGVVFIAAHWEELGDKIRVAAKHNPGRTQMDMVDKSHWEHFPINVSKPLVDRVIKVLQDHQFADVEADPTFDWHDDTITPAKWMFPDGTPPATVISLNARFNPAFHARIGKALSELRKENILIVGTGGAVHNLYRNNWVPMLTKGDNFQQGTVPAKWSTDFRQQVLDVIEHNSGPNLAGGLIRLTNSPLYRDAHPTDDHYFPLLVAAGAASCSDDYGKKMAETWELQNMCNAQFVWGKWGVEAR